MRHPQAKIFILNLLSQVVSALVGSTPPCFLSANDLGTYYNGVCNRGANGIQGHWTNRFFGDGFGITSALCSISNNKTALAPDDIFTRPIFIFGSYGSKGGGVFAGALKLINDGYKYFNIVFIIDYFNPNSDASIVCHKLLNDIEELAKLRNVNVKIYRFNIPDGNINLRHHLPEIRRIEKLAELEGVMAIADGHVYPVVDSLNVITEGRFPSEILVDGIAGVQFATFKKDNNGIPTESKLVTIHAAIFLFAAVAKSATSIGATVVVNVLPSGMDKDSGNWMTEVAFQFPFHYVLSPGWPILATNAAAFHGAGIYWIFFKLPPLLPAHVFQHDRCLPPPPESTLFQIMLARFGKILKMSYQETQLHENVNSMLLAEKNASFMLYTKQA